MGSPLLFTIEGDLKNESKFVPFQKRDVSLIGNIYIDSNKTDFQTFVIVFGGALVFFGWFLLEPSPQSWTGGWQGGCP